MLILPMILPSQATGVGEALADAILLTLVVSPVLYWTLLRPLQKVGDLRAKLLLDQYHAIETERQKISTELHDGVGQSLTLLVSGLRSLSAATTTVDVETKSKDLQSLAMRTLQDIKRIAKGLRPSQLDDLGLASAVQQICSEIRQNHAMDLQVDVQDIIGVRLPPDVETVCFRVFQEAINNVLKHSQATSADVLIRLASNGLSLRIKDNGKGIEKERIGALRNGEHLGLIGMRERLRTIAGNLEVHSEGGSGTEISAFIPGVKPIE